QNPSSQVPTALVEDVKSVTAGVEFMDYLVNGQTIKLQPRDVLVLSYHKSCEHETITGGTVLVGAERSDVPGGQIVRIKVPCDGGRMRLSAQQASESAASSFRSVDPEPTPYPTTLYGRTPLIQIPRALAREERTLLIERTDRLGENHHFKIDDVATAAGFVDLAKFKVSLARSAIYDASIGDHKRTFQIDAGAKSGRVPIVSRLLSLR